MRYEVKPPGNVIETSISDAPDDLSVVDLQIVVTVEPDDHLDTLASLRFTVDAELTTNPASITPQAGSFGVWELVGPVDPGGSSFVATPVSTPLEGTAWVFHLRDVEVATGLEDGTITVTEISTDGTETVVPMRIRKVDPVLRIDYFRMVDGPEGGHAQEPSLLSGASATLAWATVAAEEISVWGPHVSDRSMTGTGSARRVAEDGTCTISPVTTSTYTLVATSRNAHAVAQVTVTVTDKIVVPSVEDRHGPVVPRGLIAMWSGPIDDLPAGWALCDGGGGRPDLRSRFVVGARPDAQEQGYAVGRTGGADAVRLTSDQMPSHGHSLTGAGKHSHALDVLQFKEQREKVQGFADADRTLLIKGVIGSFATTEVSSHTHTVGSAGRDAAHENRPPFYALAFIYKL